MNTANKKLVVFDLDGTLNKTELYAVPAHKKAMEHFGVFDKTDEMIISTFGASGMDSVESLIGTCDLKTKQDYLAKTSQYESELIQTNAGEYEGSSALLDRLKAAGYQTAICSNSSIRYITMVLDALNLSEKIDYIQPLLPDMTKNDTLKILLEKVKPEKAVMVGDRIFDKLAARYNDIPFIGCLYGFEQSEIADADQPVTCTSDIYIAVEELIGK